MHQPEFILHKNLSDADLNKIVATKSTAWPYEPFEHKRWIQAHLNPDDIHLLLKGNEGELLAYLNLINIEMIINNTNIKGFGVGNVCATYRGKGQGTIILAEANKHLMLNNFIGLLFCKESLIPFYTRMSWTFVPMELANLTSELKGVNTLIFNYQQTIHSFKYNGVNF